MDTKEINNFIKVNYELMTDKEMARITGISYLAVKDIRNRFGLRKTKKSRQTQDEIQTEISILEQYVNSKSIKATMDKLGLSYEVVKTVLDDYRQLGGALC